MSSLRIMFLLGMTALLWPTAARSLSLRWSSGLSDEAGLSAAPCTLVVHAGPSENTLPANWQLAWACSSDSGAFLQIIPLDHREADPFSAPVCELQSTSSSDDSLSATTHADFCRDAGAICVSAYYLVYFAANERALIGIVGGGDTNPAASVTINGGAGLTLPPILSASSVSWISERAVVSVSGDNLQHLARSALSTGVGDSVPLEQVSVSSTAVRFVTPYSVTTIPAGARVSLLGPAGLAVRTLTPEQLEAPTTVQSKVILRFRRFLIEPPAGKQGGALAEFTTLQPSFLDSLAQAGVDHLARLFPGAQRSDTLARNSLGEEVRLDDLCDWYVGNVTSGHDVLDAASAIASISGTTYSAPDEIVTGVAASPPDDPLYSAQWGLTNTGQDYCSGFTGIPGFDIGAQAAWGVPTIGPATRIAFLDSGIITDQEDLLGRIDPGACFYPIYQSNTCEYRDTAPSHGTSVASVAVARGNNGLGMAGVDWTSHIVPIKVAEGPDNGTSDIASVSAGINWAAAVAHTPILNISLSFPGGECNADIKPWDPMWTPFFEACRDAFYRGSLIVASSGNCNYHTPDSDGHIARGYPAGFANPVFAVGAITPNGRRWDDQAIFGTAICPSGSNSHSCGGSNGGKWLDVMAPGGRFIIAALDAHSYYPFRACSSVAYPESTAAYFGGTSASAPMVSGIASLLERREPSLTGEDLAQIITRTAGTLPGPSYEVGNGLANASDAMSSLTGSNLVLHGIAGATIHFSVVDSSVVVDPLVLYDYPNEPQYPPNGSGPCKRYQLQARIAWPFPFAHAPEAWTRSSGTLGVSDPSTDLDYSTQRHYDYLESVYGAKLVSATADSAVFETYVWKLFDCAAGGNHPCIWPASFDNVRVAWTAIGVSRTTDVGEKTSGRVQFSVFPNPISRRASISLDLPSADRVALRTYDVSGRLVATIFDGILTPGHHLLSAVPEGSSSGFAPGVYFVEMRKTGMSARKRMIILGDK